MFRAYPKSLITNLSYLQVIVSTFSKGVDDSERLASNPTENEADHAITVVTRLKETCEGLGLETSASLLEDTLPIVTPTEEFQPRRKDIVQRLESVHNTIVAEIKKTIFLRINKSDQEYYEQDSLFGDVVESSFASAKYDIGEAGKCLALNRSTACVLHLMRVLELGLNSLAGHFQISFAHTNWNQVIEQIESKIRNIDKDPNKPQTWKDDRKFYSEAANQLRYFKDSWRNYAMHIHDKYTPEEALIVFTSVKVFMQQISKRLNEP